MPSFFLVSTFLLLTSSLCQAFVLAPATAARSLAFQPISSRSEGGMLTSNAATPASSTTALDATQLLEFIEPETNVRVKLVGAMHYNPTSIALARDTVQSLAEANQLGSVIIESCDVRYESAQNSSAFLQKLLQSEMRAACDVAVAYDRPVVLGDQRINITVDKMKAAFKETIIDLAQPPFGWQRIFNNITEAWQAGAAPSVSDNEYLETNAFLDPRLLIAAPISFFKYPLSYLVKSPIPTITVLTLLFVTDSTGTATTPEQLGWSDVVASLSFALFESAVFARIIFKEILAERNDILADSILAQCRIYAAKGQQKQGWFGTSFGATPQQADDIMYVPDTNNGIQFRKGDDDKTVVAILGMAHCNGIKKLLLKE